MSAGLVMLLLVAEPCAPKLARCAALLSASERLSCFDALAQPGFVHSGTGAAEVPLDVKEPQLLHYESSDVVLVLEIMQAPQRLIQNIHLGGQGEGSFLIDAPGRYFVRVRASGSWRLWLAPPPKPSGGPR